jgi:hypothetical protein
MEKPAPGWRSLSPQQRQDIERELRARGIDPASVASVRLESPAARPSGLQPPSTPDLADDMVDLTRPTNSPTDSVSATVTSRIEFNINGQRQVFSSWDEVPDELRALLQAAQRAANPSGSSHELAPDAPIPAPFSAVSTRAAKLAPEDIAQLEELLRTGRKIPAVKLIRERTNLSLAEAKTIADAMESALGLSKKPGCAAILLLTAGLGATLYALI